MRYGKLSNLAILPESKEDGKLKAQQYCAEILDKELFDFWMESMEDIGYVFVMDDGAPYHQGYATKRRKDLMDVGWERHQEKGNQTTPFLRLSKSDGDYLKMMETIRK